MADAVSFLRMPQFIPRFDKRDLATCGCVIGCICPGDSVAIGQPRWIHIVPMFLGNTASRNAQVEPALISTAAVL